MVEYPPKFVDGKEGAMVEMKLAHGHSHKLTCFTDENPRGALNWFFTAKDSTKAQNLQFSEPELSLDHMSDSKQGTYECLIKNSVGTAKRSFKVSDYPKGECFFKLLKYSRLKLIL